MGMIWFGVGSLAMFVLTSILLVFSVEHVEHAWGKSGAFQILCLLSFVATFLLVVGFGLGAALSKRFPLRACSLLLGVASAATFVFLLWVTSVGQTTSWASIFLLPFIGGVAPLFQRRSKD
ncbi:hypothetical protein [Variovorax sp. V213]|jgi:hypothetical protein|uniref:hypothetical protein n=1 Tax=Variovorax sp. V213 TaxID=3065955 RepID=UPI0034E8715E